jgi:enediyne biosynthesis protein E4
VALALAGGLTWSVRVWWTGRRYESAMAEVESEIGAGRYAIACRDLEELLSWRADPTGGIVYVLGSCELARGRYRAADEAWARVMPGSAFSERAIRGRLRLLHDRGQYAAAERLINDAAEDPRNDRSALRLLLVPMYRLLGRIDEAERLIEDHWEHLNAMGEGALEPAIQLLRRHIELTLKPAAVEDVRAELDAAAGPAPDDDRVWLGRANLAIRTGDYGEAGRWLEACLLRRPEDAAVWRARLSWGIAANRADVVQQALTHLPAASSSRAQVLRLRAWLSSHRGDVESERRELESLIAAGTADPTALGRLARLAEQDARHDLAAERLREKAEIDRLRARYERLHNRNQPIRDAAEMAHLAEQLDRTFEARGFLTVAISEDPDRRELRHDLERIGPRPATIVGRGLTLADVLAHEPNDVRHVDMTPGR